jgi:hypothetical protein
MSAPESKNPAGRPGEFAEQGALFEPLPFSPEWPSSATKEGQLLAALLDGVSLNHPEFGSIARTWRLAAYAFSLKQKGWHIRTVTEDGAPWTGAHCGIARYALEPADIAAVRRSRT